MLLQKWFDPIVICTLLVIDLAWPILLDAYYHFSQLGAVRKLRKHIFAYFWPSKYPN